MGIRERTGVRVNALAENEAGALFVWELGSSL